MEQNDLSKVEGVVGWECPSNIALVKYWGKAGHQIPMNPSMSFTLKKSVVRLLVTYFAELLPKKVLKTFSLNGLPNERFQMRINSFLETLKPQYPFLNHVALEIESRSTFPHSAGIASSAAAFGALALALESIAMVLGSLSGKSHTFWQNTSNIARLGSGSACRSVYGGFALWGYTPAYEGSSDQYAVGIAPQDIHPVFGNLQDAILIADDSEKAVSSSSGHALMQNHPYREARIEQAGKNLRNLLHALKTGEETLFAEIVENEALTLHGLMMTSNPGFALMKPATLAMIEKIRDFRQSTGTNVCFTLDAGPNIHLIYFDRDKAVVRNFVEKELASLCKNGKWIDDGIGPGPVKLTV